MTSPSIKEALEPVFSFLDELADNAKPGRRKPLNPILIGGIAKLYAEGLRSALATLSPPAGERREAIALQIWHRFADPNHIEWRDETHKDEFLMCADAILASGLVQDEAGIRADEREKCIRDMQRAYPEHAWLNAACAAIRSARDGGAES